MTNPSTVPGEGHTKGLSELLAKVQAASGPDSGLNAEIHEAMSLPFEMEYWTESATTPVRNLSKVPAYTASIDAALALVERVLSGKDDGPLLYARAGYWTADANDDRHYLQTFNVAVGTPPTMVEIEMDGITEPLAILAATLQALIAGSKP